MTLSLMIAISSGQAVVVQSVASIVEELKPVIR